VPALTRLTRSVALLVMAAALSVSGCKAKASSSQCENLIDRYAELVVTEKFPDASAGQVEAERQREKVEARGDDSFKNCPSEVSQVELSCAMQAKTADAFEKCLE
jgi:hypothetical protein